MMVGGIRWVAGEGKKTDCSGTVWSSFKRTVLVADANQPIGIDAAKDGKVYWSEAGLARHRGRQLRVAGRDHDARSERRAGQQDDGRGHPDARRSRQLRGRRPRASRCSRASTWPIRTSATCSRTSRRAPARATTGRRATNPPRQALGYNQIMRWTLTADGKSVVPGSERVILRVPKMKIGGTTSTATRRPGQVPPRASRAARRTPAPATWVAPAWTSTPPATCTSASATTCRRTRRATAATRRWTTAPRSAGTRARPRPTRPTCAARCSASSRRRTRSPRARRPGVGATYAIPSGNLFPLGTGQDPSRDLRDGLPPAVHAAHRPEEPGHRRHRRVRP